MSARWRSSLTFTLGFVLAFCAPVWAADDADESELTPEKLHALFLQLDDRDTGFDALKTLSDSGDDRVKLGFERLMDRALFLHEGKLVHAGPGEAGPDGKKLAPLFNAFTTEPIEVDGEQVRVPTSDLEDFKGDRQVRRDVKGALAVLELKAKNLDTRLAAVKRVGDARDLSALATLREIAENDKNAKVRRIAAESAALIVADGVDPEASVEDRVAAIRTLGELDSIRGKSMLEMLGEAQKEDPTLGDEGAAAIQRSLDQIDWHMTVVAWVGHLFKGLSAGSILVILSLGLAITFGLMGVINMAHGEMLMVGAVTAWAVHEMFVGSVPPEWFNWYFVAAFPLSFIVAGFAGWLVEVLVVRHLYKRPLDSLLATIGITFILIQGVRMWKGDNLGMSSPSWLTGGVEVIQDLILPYNRLFIMALTAACVAFVVCLFRFTRLGLLIRGTVQNREMAESLGVSTRMVDMCTFSLGAGLAGIAGYAITLVSNVTPEMGQGYIVKSFLVVVIAGVGNLAGVVIAGLGLGFMEKIIEPFTDATWAQVIVLILVIAFIQRRPGGLFPDKGRLADQPDAGGTPWMLPGLPKWSREAKGFALMAAIGLIGIPALHVSGMMSGEMVNKLGQFAAFAIVAIGLDLVWGYMGVLSLCQFLFFALGGYAMGMYLAHHGPLDGVNEIPRALYVVSSSVDEITLPWFWVPFKWLPMALVLGLLIPAVVAFLVGLSGFVSRVKGVYFAILTQAVTVAFWLVFQKNDIKLCGTNGLTNFVEIAGFSIAGNPDAAWYAQTRFWLYIVSVLCLLGVFAIAKGLVHSGFGRVLVAIRDDEPRLRFLGYKTWIYKTAAFTIAGVFAALGGMLYTPQKGIITPEQMTAFSSILVVVWVALGGRGTLWGAVIGAVSVNLLYDTLTSRAPDAWPFVLGGMFVLVVLLMPGGLMSIPHVARRLTGRFRRPAPAVAGAPTEPIENAT